MGTWARLWYPGAGEEGYGKVKGGKGRRGVETLLLGIEVGRGRKVEEEGNRGPGWRARGTTEDGRFIFLDIDCASLTFLLNVRTHHGDKHDFHHSQVPEVPGCSQTDEVNCINTLVSNVQYIQYCWWTDAGQIPIFQDML